MMEYLLLANPGHNRVYLDAAKGAAVAELSRLLPGCKAEEGEIGGQPAFRLTCASPLEGQALEACAKSSLFYALFEVVGDLLRPVTVADWRYLPESLNTIVKYPGKTNEQFTRMMVNLALSACETVREIPTLLDPMCGQGTTLFDAAIRGWNAVGLEVQEQPVHKGATYFVKYLESGRYKHKRSEEKRTQGGKRIAQLVTVEYAAKKDDWYAENTRKVQFFRADSALCEQLLPKNAADLLACDLPYGVQHGASGGGSLQRNAAKLVAEVAPGWRKALRPGAGVALAYNSLTTPRHQLAAAMEQAGFEVLPQVEGLEHRVDQSILRDVLVARKPK